MKLTKTSEALKKECETLGLDVSFDAKQVLNQASSSEKAVNSSIFETTEATSSINSLNVYYSNATTFQTSSEKCVVRPEQSKELNRSNKANASTCHPICENVGIQYDEAQLEGVNNKPPRVCSGGTLLSGPAVPQNGSGETRIEQHFNCSQVWAFEEMLQKFQRLQVEHAKLMGFSFANERFSGNFKRWFL